MYRIFAKQLGIVAVCTMFIMISGQGSKGAEISVRPAIDIVQEYNDNIFLESSNKNSDYITRLIPSINLSYKAPFWEWQLGYALNWWYYHKMGRSFDSHTLNLNSDMNIIENFLFLNITDAYSNIALDERSASSVDNLNVNRTDTNTFAISPYIRYRITPVATLTAGYRYANIWFREEGGINRQVHTGYASIGYIFSPKFNASAGVEYAIDKPEGDEPENDRASAYVSAVYNLSPRTTFNGTLGRRWIDFDNRDDSSDFYYNFGIVHRFHQTGELELRISSDVLTSATYGIYESRSEELIIRYGETFRFDGSIFHRKGEYVETDTDDEVYGITTGLEYRPDPRLTFRLSGSYEKSKFMPEDETSELYRASGEIAYQLAKRASLILRDTYSIYNGRTSLDDYKNNIIAVLLRIAL